MGPDARLMHMWVGNGFVMRELGTIRSRPTRDNRFIDRLNALTTVLARFEQSCGQCIKARIHGNHDKEWRHAMVFLLQEKRHLLVFRLGRWRYEIGIQEGPLPMNHAAGWIVAPSRFLRIPDHADHTSDHRGDSLIGSVSFSLHETLSRSLVVSHFLFFF